MNRALRVKKVEERVQPTVRIPHVLKIHTLRGETVEETKAEFIKKWGKLPKGHQLLAVPAQPETPDEEAEWERRFEEQQVNLINQARTGQ